MFFRRNKSLFGASVEPSCCYCSRMVEEKDDGTFVCKLDPRHPKEDMGDCRQFRYDPLLRKPQQQAKLPSYRPEDFQL